MVLNQILDGLADFGGFLDLVEDDDGFALLQTDIVDELELKEETVAVIDVGDSFLKFIGGIGKIHFYIRSVLVLGKFLCNGGLAHATGAFDEEGGTSIFGLLPFLELSIYLASKYAFRIFHFSHISVMIQTQK